MDEELLRTKNLFHEKAKRFGVSVDIRNRHDIDSIGFSYHTPYKEGTVWKGIELVGSYGEPLKFTLMIGASSYHPIKELLGHIPLFGKLVSKPSYLSWEDRVVEFQSTLDLDKLNYFLEEGLKRLEIIDRDFLEKYQK